MASISSVASVFVLLLVAYCSSVPLPTDNDYTTGKSMVERESMSMMFPVEHNTHSTKLAHKRESMNKKESDESREYTTELPLVERDLLDKKESEESREYTTELPLVERELVDKKESEESREYTTGLPLVERELEDKKDSEESRELTTGLPRVQREFMNKKESEESREYTTGLPLVEREFMNKKDSEESREYTTERTLIKDGHKKRTIIGETTFAPIEATSMITKRSHEGEHNHVEGDSEEITTERTIVTGERDFDDTITVGQEGEGNNNNNDDDNKRSVEIDMVDGLTTEYATTKDGHHKRTASVTVEPLDFEATSMFNERALDDESEEKTTERSHVPRTVDFDRFTTMESATDFNGRVEHKHERDLVEPEMTTVVTEHKPRFVAVSHSVKSTKGVYMPVTGQKYVGRTEYSSVNAGTHNKVYPKTNYRN